MLDLVHEHVQAAQKESNVGGECSDLYFLKAPQQRIAVTGSPTAAKPFRAARTPAGL